MSKFNTPIQQRIWDPQFYSENFRAEFRLAPNTMYWSDMRLINLGISSATGATDYNPALGGVGCIESIELRDGGTLLDRVDQFSIYQVWKNLKESNSDNISKNRYTYRNSLGYVCDGDFQVASGEYGEGIVARIQNPPTTPVKTTEAATLKAVLPLGKVFPLLAEMPAVPTNVFKQFTVVVNFKNVSQLANVISPSNRTDMKTSRPSLICYEMMDTPEKVNAMRDFRGARWLAIENDSVYLPAVTASGGGPLQQKVFQVNGFKNKYVEDLLIVNTPQTSTTWITTNVNQGFANQSSFTFHKPTVQLRLNGKNLLPANGLLGKNRRLAYLVDSMGDFNLIQAQNKLGMLFSENVLEPSQVVAQTVGQVDYTGLKVKKYVDEMQLQVDRYGLENNAALNQAFRLNLFARVDKSIIVSQNGYKVVYN